MENPNSPNSVATTESSESPTYHWFDPRRLIWGNANESLQPQAEQKQELEPANSAAASWNLFGYFSAEQPAQPDPLPLTRDPDYVAFVFTPPQEPHPGAEIANQTAAEEAAQIEAHLSSTPVLEPLPLAATPSDTSATVKTDDKEATSTTAPEPKPDEKITGKTDSNELEQAQRNLAIEAERVRIAAEEQARSLQLQQEQAQAHQRNAMLLLQQQQAASERRLAAEQERQAEEERQRAAAEKKAAEIAFSRICSTGAPNLKEHHRLLRDSIIAAGF